MSSLAMVHWRDFFIKFNLVAMVFFKMLKCCSFELTNIYTSTYRLAHIYWILGWVLECEEGAGSWQYSSAGGVAHWRVF